MITGTFRVKRFRPARLAGCWCLWLCLWGSSVAWGDPVTDYNVAVEFYKQQRWDLAAEACQEFLSRHPTHERAPTARLYLAQALLHQRKFAEARDQFRTFLSVAGEHQDRPLAMYRVGECSYFLGDYPAAEADLQRFLTQYPEHALVEWGMVYLGESQLRQKRYDAARKSFEAAIKKSPQGRLLDDAEFGLASALDALQQRDAALSVYQRVADRAGSPRAAEAEFNIGSRYFDDKQFAESAAAFERVTRKNPVPRLAGLAELNAGYAYFHLQQFPQAIEHFEQAAKQEQFAPTAGYWTGLSQKSQGEYAAAVQTLSGVLKASPEPALAQKVVFQLADAEFRQQNYPRAMELFHQVVQQWPDGELADDALHSECEAALQADELAQATRLHQQFLETFPNSGLKLVQILLYGRILLAQGDQAKDAADRTSAYEQAARVLKQVQEASTVEHTRSLAGYQLARAYERLQQDQAVIDMLAPLLKGGADSQAAEFVDAWLLRGNARLRLGDDAGARGDYEQYLKLTTSPEEQLLGLSGLASALAGLKDWKQLEGILPQLAQLDSAGKHLGQAATAAGDAAFDDKQWAVADKFFAFVTERGPGGAYFLPALSGRAHAQYELGQYASAAQLFEQVMPAAGEEGIRSHSAYMRALSLRQAGELQPALAAFQQAIVQFSQISRQPPAMPDPEVGLNAYLCEKGGARVARELKDISTADKLYEAAYKELKLQPPEAQGELDLLLNEWAELSYNAENFKRSDEVFALLIKERPDSPLADDARLILAESLRFGGETEKAAQALQRLADDPRSDEFVRQRSLVHLLDLAAEAGQWSDVVKFGERLNSEFPENSHQDYVAFRRGEAFLHERDFQQAVKILDSLKQQLEPRLAMAPAWWPEVWLLLAEADLALKDYAALEAVVADLKARAPESPLLYRADVLLGRSLENRARFEEARKVFTRVIESEAARGTETAAESQFRIAESYLKENNLPVALKEYYKVYAGYDAPRYEAAALFQAATCDASLKHFPEAAETYRKLIREFPESEFTEKATAALKELEGSL